VKTVKNVYAKEGAIGFYRGWIPPFMGSVLYRSLQFAMFEAAYTGMAQNETLCTQIALGVDYRTVIAGILSGSSRACVECPFEYAKVKRQTGQRWEFNQAFKGFSTLLPRSTIMMTTYFICV